MNKNRENYKKAIDQIHVDSDLKNKVLEKAKKENKTKKSIYYLRYAVSIAAVAIVAVVGVAFSNKTKEDVLKPVVKNEEITEVEKISALDDVSIKRFKNVEELREILKEYENQYVDVLRGTYSIAENAVNDAIAIGEESTKSVESNKEDKYDLNYSKTNNQVESVDEADFVKTDGKYIYYSKNNRIYIVDKDLNLKATINEKDFCPSQIFINGNKLVAFGSSYNRVVLYDIQAKTDSIFREDVNTYVRPKTFAKVFDLKDIEKPELVREIAVDGYYHDARMIGDNVYFISNYGFNFYKELTEMNDNELLPEYRDSSISNETKNIEVTDIAYFEDSKSYQYSLIAGFNLNSKKEVNIETFFGFGDNLYVSENNMYIIGTHYSDLYNNGSQTTIYKFKLQDSNIIAQASCKVEGNVNNQFSLDEYEGNLRVATTFTNYNYNENIVKARLTIFNEKLEKIGEIDNLVEDERIYSVRFIGNVGYVVTFEEVDPLWVIDLSDPTNPKVKGELEIPGYSSYLHPYDETHIIGIGYDVKPNGYGGVTNDKIKLSMFDVSDLENPKEIFKVSLGNDENYKSYYSTIMSEHKSLFFNKSRNLIGFPINVWNRKELKTKSGIVLYKIDLENNKFEEVKTILEENTRGVERELYIENNMYLLSNTSIEKYDLNTFENTGSLKLENSYDDWNYVE